MLALSASHLELDVHEFISVPDYVAPLGAQSDSSSEIKNLYFVGGFEEEYRKLFLQYKVSQKEWIQLDPLPGNRAYCVAGAFDGDRLWMGGGKKNEELTGDVDEFDLSSSTWTTYKVATLPRASSTWQACGNQQTVYLSNAYGEFCTYSSQTKDIVTKKAMPCERCCHSASYSAILHSVFVADGWDRIDSVTEYFPRIDKYDIASDTWQSVGFAKIKCSQRAAALCGDELYLLGGCDETKKFALDTVEVCNVRTGKTWSVPDLPNSRNLSRAALLYNNVICVFGDICDTATKSVDAYDVREGKWTADIVPDMPVANGGFGLAWN